MGYPTYIPRIGGNLAEEIDEELARAEAKFKPFNSNHEGYAVLLEEVEEMWHEIKHGTAERFRAEAIQVAAMAVRLVKCHDAREAARKAGR